jgi:hypothetical protein
LEVFENGPSALRDDLDLDAKHVELLAIELCKLRDDLLAECRDRVVRHVYRLVEHLCDDRGVAQVAR